MQQKTPVSLLLFLILTFFYFCFIFRCAEIFLQERQIKRQYPLTQTDTTVHMASAARSIHQHRSGFLVVRLSAIRIICSNIIITEEEIWTLPLNYCKENFPCFNAVAKISTSTHFIQIHESGQNSTINNLTKLDTRVGTKTVHRSRQFLMKPHYQMRIHRTTWWFSKEHKLFIKTYVYFVYGNHKKFFHFKR